MFDQYSSVVHETDVIMLQERSNKKLQKTGSLPGVAVFFPSFSPIFFSSLLVHCSSAACDGADPVTEQQLFFQKGTGTFQRATSTLITKVYPPSSSKEEKSVVAYIMWFQYLMPEMNQ